MSSQIVSTIPTRLTELLLSQKTHTVSISTDVSVNEVSQSPSVLLEKSQYVTTA